MDKRTGSIFKNPEVIKLCDEMKYFHEILMVAGSFFDDIKQIEDTNGNAFLTDVNHFGVKVIATGMLEKQIKTIKQLEEIYIAEKEKLHKIRA